MSASQTTPARAQRIHSLDSLRFIAAAIVVYQHCASIHAMDGWGPLPSPLAGFLNATSAVAFFFVLSGVVLRKSLSGKPPGFCAYSAFLVKRVFRLYPLFWVALVFGVCCLLFLPLADVAGIRTSEYTAATVSGKDHRDLWQWLIQFTLVMNYEL